MDHPFTNVYGDERRALAYASLEFPGTYYLAFRDIPELLRKYVAGSRALDFGCGTGRSSRFLEERGFRVTGVDIAPAMLEHARERDPDGDYRLVPEGDLTGLESASFDLILSAFTFDNVPARTLRFHLFAEFRRLLAPGGRFLNLVSAPAIYVNEWASFSTSDFPGNRMAGSGDRVRIRMLDIPDRRPVEDVMWLDEDYRELCSHADLEVLEVHRPLGTDADPYEWTTETRISPWVIYVLGELRRSQ
jgi:SAM-dependent methyltransferase